MAAASNAFQRLSFTLPDFTRYCWVDEATRREWEPRLERISRAWAEIEYLSVVSRIRPCGLCWIPKSAVEEAVSRWRSHRLSAASVPAEGEGLRPPYSNMIRVVVGSYEDVQSFKESWQARDHDSVGRLLGYPTCCRTFFSRVWVACNCTDTTWFMATSRDDDAVHLVDAEPGKDQFCNILWRWLGIRAVPHLPCAFDCAASAALGEKLIGVGVSIGYVEEMKWLREVLSWPAEWSALHGIAEIKTPILKIATRTDSTPCKYVVRWRGSSYPERGITGLQFPYRAPVRPMTQLKVFQGGLSQGCALPERPGWQHADNGFSSREAMDRLHEPIVDLARSTLSGQTGNVLDLGCGNGMLLSKVCDGTRVIPFGVDTSKRAIEHARTILPAFSSNFVESDLLAFGSWNGRPYVLSLLMLGRLKEIGKTNAARLIAELKSKSKEVIVYLYPDWRDQKLGEMADELGVRVSELADQNVGLLLFS
jgi:hypothetical protein